MSAGAEPESAASAGRNPANNGKASSKRRETDIVPPTVTRQNCYRQIALRRR